MLGPPSSVTNPTGLLIRDVLKNVLNVRIYLLRTLQPDQGSEEELNVSLFHDLRFKGSNIQRKRCEFTTVGQPGLFWAMSIDFLNLLWEFTGFEEFVYNIRCFYSRPTCFLESKIRRRSGDCLLHNLSLGARALKPALGNHYVLSNTGARFQPSKETATTALNIISGQSRYCNPMQEFHWCFPQPAQKDNRLLRRILSSKNPTQPASVLAAPPARGVLTNAFVPPTPPRTPRQQPSLPTVQPAALAQAYAAPPPQQFLQPTPPITESLLLS